MRHMYILAVIATALSLNSCSFDKASESKALGPPVKLAINRDTAKVFKSGPAGMSYSIIVDKPGPTIKAGDFIIYRIVSKGVDGTTIQDSYFDRRLEHDNAYGGTDGDLHHCLSFLSEGDSAMFKVVNKTQYVTDSLGESYVNPLIKQVKGKWVTHYIKIVKVVTDHKLSYDQFFNIYEQVNSQYSERAKAVEEREIDLFFKNRNVVPKTTVSGTKYWIRNVGEGQTAMIGDTVLADLTLTLITGRVISTTDENIAIKNEPYSPFNAFKPVKILLTNSKQGLGFAEAGMFLKEGSEAIVIIPSKLAYGKQSIVNGIGYESLVYDVNIRKILKAN
jgi:FKBP-type peptidyl-prolyl cis-trans isomerase FkpA